MPPCIDRYRKHVDHFDLSDHQKTELIHIVYHMMENFVERAFGDDDVQKCIEGRASERAIIENHVISSEQSASDTNSLSTHFNTKKGPQ